MVSAGSVRDYPEPHLPPFYRENYLEAPLEIFISGNVQAMRFRLLVCG
jgi:hypothetical protein